MHNMVNDYDLIVVGGGPAGMMAAGRAAEKGAKVLLLEKNKELGRKLLITGKGRCNITNAEPDIKNFVAKFGENGKFLYSAFNKFGVNETINFFEKTGLKIKVERGNRVFPASDRSRDVLNALIFYLRKNKVEIKTNRAVKNFLFEKNNINNVILENGEKIKAKYYLIASGGKSYPLTGSSGDGYAWLEKMGHKIIKPRPALAPIIVKEQWVKKLEGLSLKNVGLSVYQNNKKKDYRFGEALFTNNGLSGPIALDVSRKIGQLLESSAVFVLIDFKPALDAKKLDSRAQCDFKKYSNKFFINALNDLLPAKIIPVIIELVGINPKIRVNLITKEVRKKFVQLLKNFKMEVVAISGFDKAIITAGGADIRQVDPKTMKSKIIKNLFLAGEILDIDGPTGGYNLQASFSTGYLAGDSVL